MSPCEHGDIYSTVYDIMHDCNRLVVLFRAMNELPLRHVCGSTRPIHVLCNLDVNSVHGNTETILPNTELGFRRQWQGITRRACNGHVGSTLGILF